MDEDSIVDFLKSKGIDSSFAARKHMAESYYTIPNYTGTAEQNIKLLAALRAAPTTQTYWEEIKAWVHKFLSSL